MGEELFKLCAQNCHYINRKNTVITILFQDADLARERILTKFKNIIRLIDVRFFKLNPHHITPGNLAENGLADVDVIYICSDLDRLQTSYSSRARVVVKRTVPIVRWFSKNNTTGTANKDTDNMYTIGILNSIATHDNIIDEALDRKAIAVHHLWLKRDISGYIENVEEKIREKQQIPEPKATMVPWQHLDEEIRDDNRSVIEHSLIKIRTVGQLTNPIHYQNPDNTLVDFSFLKNGSLVIQLAEMEHRRWMANKYLYAWEFNKDRNELKKEHNKMVDFDELDDSTQDYDIKQVEDLEEIWKLK